MMDMPRLVTKRLVLRPFVVADAELLERLAGTWEVADTTLNIPHPYPAGEGAVWIGTHAAHWEDGTRITLAICRAETPDTLIGAVGLSMVAQHERAELGYWIAHEEWGKGFATEASRAMVAFGFEVLGLHRVQARHFGRNPQSGNVMRKLGMKYEGTCRDQYRRWDRFEDSVMYAVLASEWKTEG